MSRLPDLSPPVPGVSLRPAAEVDIERIVALVRANLDHLSPWMPWAHPGYGAGDVRAWLDASAGDFVLTRGDAPLGVVGFNRPDPANRAIAVGYWLSADEQGQGLISAAVTGLVAHAFDILALHRVELRAAPDNRRSCAVAERCGFTREGVAREAELVDGSFRDLVVFSRLATD